MTEPQPVPAALEAWKESIRQLEGWARVRESWELAKLIDKGAFDGAQRVPDRPAG